MGCLDSCNIFCGSSLIGGFASGLTGGQTLYFSPWMNTDSNNSDSENMIFATHEAIISRLGFFTDNAPGAGESIQVAIWYNGTTAKLPILYSGAILQSNYDLTNKLHINFKDEFGFRIVTSAGCAVTKIKIAAVISLISTN